MNNCFWLYARLPDSVGTASVAEDSCKCSVCASGACKCAVAYIASVCHARMVTEPKNMPTTAGAAENDELSKQKLLTPQVGAHLDKMHTV